MVATQISSQMGAIRTDDRVAEDSGDTLRALSPPPIIEAERWIVNEEGQIEFVADVLTPSGLGLELSPTNCS